MMGSWQNHLSSILHHSPYSCSHCHRIFGACRLSLVGSLVLYVLLILILHYVRTFHLLEFLAEAFRCHVHHFQCLTVIPGPSSTENDAHGIEKFLLKTQVSEKFLHSEVNLLIQ